MAQKIFKWNEKGLTLEFDKEFLAAMDALRLDPQTGTVCILIEPGLVEGVRFTNVPLSSKQLSTEFYPWRLTKKK